MNDSGILLGLPESLRAQVIQAAEADDTTPQEWVQRAVTRQLDEREWRAVLAYGGQRARALGYTEDDVERLVVESRREARARAPHEPGHDERDGHLPPR